MKRDSGMALIAVMAALMVLSAIAIGLATSVRLEARIDASDFEAIQAEQLARSGQEFASFLEERGMKKGPDFLAGLPAEAITPLYHYRAQFKTGAADIYFDADNGKIDLNNTPPEILTNFFTIWTGSFTTAQMITDGIQDWRDRDDDVRPNGAEAAYYAPLNYAPRNSFLGIADAPLIRGLSIADFQLKLTPDPERPALRNSLDSYLSSAGGAGINVNFSPELILRSVPGLNDSQVSAILARRTERPFEDAADLQASVGLPPSSPAWRYVTVNRSANAITSIAHLNSGGPARSERRVTFSYSGYNILTGNFEPKTAIGRIQRYRGSTDESF
jgi:general secretion pathway protein K